MTTFIKKGDNSSVNRKNSKRNSRIEILRIISMLMIIAFHATRNMEPCDNQFVMITSVILGSWGILGVDIFVIISSWFLSVQQFRIEKVISIVFQTFTWVLGYSIIRLFYDLFYLNYSFNTIAHKYFTYFLEDFFRPVWNNFYWFITAYVFLLLISPFINKLLNNLSQKQLRKVLIVFIFVPIYACYASYNAVCDIIWFLYVYLLVGYIRKYGSNLINRFAKKYYYSLLILSVIISKYIIRTNYLSNSNYILRRLSFIISKTFAQTDRHSLILLLIGLLIFFNVLNEKPSNNKIINIVSSLCLGVYLFHENIFTGIPNTLDFLYRKLTSLGYFTMSYLYPLEFILFVISVFIVGCCCEWIRRTILQSIFMKAVTTKFEKKLTGINDWFNKL